MKWHDPDDVDCGVYIAWVDGTLLPSYWLLQKDYKRNKKGKETKKIEWRCFNNYEVKIKQKWINAVHDLPDIRTRWVDDFVASAFPLQKIEILLRNLSDDEFQDLRAMLSRPNDEIRKAVSPNVKSEEGD